MATAVSTLGYDSFVKRVSRHMGLDTVFANLSAEDQAIVNEIVQDGVARFYLARKWRFLHPTESFILFADIAVVAGTTVSGGSFSGGSTTITASEASFHPLMVGKSLVITTVDTFVVDGYTSPTVISVTGDASSASADTFSLAADGIYTLDADWAELEGKITYDTEQFTHPLTLTSEAKIREMKQAQVSTGIPQLAAVRIRESDGELEHRIEVMVWPVPNADYTVSSRFSLHPTLLSSAEPFPLGGAQHARTVLAACMAAAELDHDDTIGIHEETYQRRLLDSISLDKKQNAPEFLGKNDDYSDGASRRINSSHVVQVNGVTP